MIFTRRTYRVAIRRSIESENMIRYVLHYALPRDRPGYRAMLRTQINHTRKLQARKRKERK